MLRIILGALTVPIAVLVSSAAMLIASLAYGLGALNVAADKGTRT